MNLSQARGNTLTRISSSSMAQVEYMSPPSSLTLYILHCTLHLANSTAYYTLFTKLPIVHFTMLLQLFPVKHIVHCTALTYVGIPYYLAESYASRWRCATASCQLSCRTTGQQRSTRTEPNSSPNLTFVKRFSYLKFIGRCWSSMQFYIEK